MEGRLKELRQEEIKDRMYKMLCTFAEWCDRNGIRYFLSGGTLLGAARHHDFIPWDDDIDVLIPRPDYGRLLRIAEGGMVNGYRLYAYEYGNSFFPHAKLADTGTYIPDSSLGVQHLWIDLFPMDGLPDNRLLSSLKLTFAALLKRFPSWCNIRQHPSRFTFTKLVCWAAVSPAVLLAGWVKGRGFWTRTVIRYASSIPFGASRYVGGVVSSVGPMERMPKEAYLTAAALPIRGRMFHVPGCWEFYLVSMFGPNWQEAPSVEKRRKAHYSSAVYEKSESEDKDMFNLTSLYDDFKKTKAAEDARRSLLYKAWLIGWHFSKSETWSLKFLLPWHVWIQKLDVVVTTRCNLACKGCSHLMPYYKKPQDLDKDKVIASMRKVNEAIDWVDHYNFLGGEPFLNPDLKYFINELPDKKYNKAQVLTNAMAVPDDPELFESMRRKNVVVVMSQYPSNQERQKKLIEVLEREHVQWHKYEPAWFDFGEPCNYMRTGRQLRKQFLKCGGISRNLFDGKLYYCFRCSHVYDLGFCESRPGECVDLLGNGVKENRREIRRLSHRRQAFAACQYCLKGTKEYRVIQRGK